MDKALLILPDNNKGKFITKGFSSAFLDFNFFVYEKKIYDLNIEEVLKILPQVIFCFWSGISKNETLLDFFNKVDLSNIRFIHFAELKKDIPSIFYEKTNHYCFSMDSKLKSLKVGHSINKSEYKSKFNGYKYNITFSGNPNLKNRQKILSLLIKNFGPINIFCRSFDFYNSVENIRNENLLDDYMLELYKSSYRGYSENQKELAEIYVSSKINIEIENPDKKTISYRALEILASGGFLISTYNKKIISQFENGKEIETYSSEEELIDKINFYLKNLNIARTIANNGRKNAISNHKFYDRLKKMLKVVYGKNTSN